MVDLMCEPAFAGLSSVLFLPSVGHLRARSRACGRLVADRFF
jgi:hypothetical protein